MMAGVVAMAAVIEDFDTQPCKKSRKDENSPLVKTITNYFSPMPKPVEKPFSPPRANNIMDYFMRKAPIKTSSPEQQKVNSLISQASEKSSSLEAVVKHPPQKRGRKPGKCARKLGEYETLNQPDKDGGVSETKKEEVLKSDCTPQTVKHDPGDCIPGGEVTGSVQLAKSTDKSEDALDITDLSPIKPSKDKVKNTKPCPRNVRKKQQRETKDSVQQENSLCNVSVEVNVDEASMLNRSTVTISYEDFVRSQSQDDTDPSAAGDQSTEEKEEDTKAAKLDFPFTQEANSGEPSLQVSPRTVTVQADVHVVSPKQEAAPVGKLASIFHRKKGAASPKEVLSPSHVKTGPESPLASVPHVKRKSNVVLEEDDLELAVLESDSVPKCGETERKQFMAAFKQAAVVDKSKSKSVGKQKHTEEKVSDPTEQAAESEAAPPSPATSQDKKVGKRGRRKARGTKRAVDTQSTVAASPVDEAGDGTEEPSVPSTPTAPVLRRSRREAAVKALPESQTKTPARETKQRGCANSQSPASIRKSKHGVFVAQMILCDSDTSQSPIRIKFIRVNPSDCALKDNVSFPNSSQPPSHASEDLKKRKQTKTKVEKEKVIQQSKKAGVKEQEAPRRSARSEASTKWSYCEDEDSVISLDHHQMTPQKTNSQKSLRSLIDVLGKSSTAGSKGSSGGPEKKARKASAVISIFDESSRDTSDNSLDGEQFRARREFLKSGLPDSFKKQIAKTAATREAYSLTCASFQAVTHIKQASKDCPLWSLLWPQSSLLSHLQEVCSQTRTLPPSHSVAVCVKTQPAPGAVFEKVSGWRTGISESVRQLLTEEVASCNPCFPAETFVSRFLKRRTDHQQQFAASEAETQNRTLSSTPPVQPVGGKRKRTDGEAEATAKVAKKQRADALENISPAESEPTKRRSRMRRSQGSKDQKDGRTEPTNKSPPASPEDGAVVVILDEDDEKKDVVREDVLWTDKYQPQHSSEIVGNTASVRKLHSWLKEWKIRADREERTKQKDKKEEGSYDSDWDCGELDSLEGDDMCNTLLITGPTGVGKTAAVYACAQELGFKVFEVNASSQRSGRLILSQLKEATQSHQVDSQGVNAHKPSFFNSYSSGGGASKPGYSPRKINSPRRAVSSPRKHPQSPRGAKRGGLAPSSLAKFFKMSQPASKEPLNTAKNEPTAASRSVTKGSELQSKNRAVSVNLQAAGVALKEKSGEEQSKKTATSLILFEEVDVIFDDDSGFLAAVKTFMATTKRPVILTTSDPAFSTMFDGNFEEIHFKAPSLLDASSFLRSLCLAEDVRTDQQDVGSLLRLNRCDLRQSLLQLQFWTRSGGGLTATLPLSISGENAEPKPEVDGASCDISVPPCDTGCTESMLGLPNITANRDPWQLLKGCLSEDPSCWELLANSKCRGVDLLYSNMETLLPLPLTRLSASAFKMGPLTTLRKDEPPASPEPQPPELADHSDDGSPLKVSSRMKKSKRQRRLSGQDGLLSDLDSEDDFVSLAPRRRENIHARSGRKKVKRTLLTPEERLKSLPVSECLQSMGDFFESMSFLDSCLSTPHRGASPVLKDGLTDELGLETDRESLRRGDRVFEMHSAAVALSFHRCRTAAAEAWGKAQRLEGELGREAAAELTLPVADHLSGHTFNQDGPCRPQVVQQRREVMDNLMFRGTFGIVCSRSAAASSYLPTLRTICRLEQLKEQDKVKRRFLHYLDSIHLGLEKSLLQRLAHDFP